MSDIPGCSAPRRGRGAATKHLGGGVELDVHLQPQHGVESSDRLFVRDGVPRLSMPVLSLTRSKVGLDGVDSGALAHPTTVSSGTLSSSEPPHCPTRARSRAAPTR